MAEQVNQWKDLKKGGVREVRANDYNNKEFVVEGKKWYVLIAQHYTNGEMEEDTNIMCPVSLMLFGTLVSGMTYAFEKKEYRDDFFGAINSPDRLKVEKLELSKDEMAKLKGVGSFLKTYPRCGLCGKLCECSYGHNPFPLLTDDITKRVCDKCNAEQVIPARMAVRKAVMSWEQQEKEKIAEEKANELINSADIAPPKQEKVKTKAELKKEQTRNANKAKAEEKKLKEEQDRAIAQAQAQAEAQRKKKAREVAIKKQKAWLKEGERFLAELEKLNEEGA
jgi:hypothetical protein